LRIAQVNIPSPVPFTVFVRFELIGWPVDPPMNSQHMIQTYMGVGRGCH
jgi:hypothetical protein